MAAMKDYRASCIGIGTELTQGQILNRNGQVLSEHLVRRGIRTNFHLIVPDEKELILEAFAMAQKHSQLVFVTGGLGPTSDDFTREVVAEFLDLKLEWHEQAWLHIVDRFRQRGREPKDIQKQQAYIPRTARLLVNPAGTACGFFVQKNGMDFFVLPGPPKEIEAIWPEIDQWLSEKVKEIDPWITKIWTTRDAPESEIALLTEEALKGSNLERGYRAHNPEVEVKVTYQKSKEADVKPYLEKIERALSSHIPS